MMKNYLLAVLAFAMFPFYLGAYTVSKLFKIKGYEDMENIIEWLDIATEF